MEAGGALAVDRHGFAALVTEQHPQSHPNITVVHRRGDGAAGGGRGDRGHRPPHLRRPGPAAASGCWERAATSTSYDAAAPLVSFESVDMDSAWFASRYDKGTPDYINCPLTEEEYQRLLAGADHRPGGAGPRL